MRARIALFVSHLLGMALLLWLGYYWLSMDESDTKHLVLSGLIALLVVVGATALHGIAMAHFSGRKAQAKNLLPLLALSLLTFAIYGVLLWMWERFGGSTAYVMGSAATMAVRKPLSPNMFHRILQVLFWLVQWVALPAFLLPLAAAISVEGWRGWTWRPLAPAKRWLYWIEVGALLFCALWLPLKLFFWVPAISSFGGQMGSFIARVGFAYLLFVTAALVLDFLTSSGRPREIQPSTVPSP